MENLPNRGLKLRRQKEHRGENLRRNHRSPPTQQNPMATATPPNYTELFTINQIFETTPFEKRNVGAELLPATWRACLAPSSVSFLLPHSCLLDKIFETTQYWEYRWRELQSEREGRESLFSFEPWKQQLTGNSRVYTSDTTASIARSLCLTWHFMNGSLRSSFWSFFTTMILLHFFSFFHLMPSNLLWITICRKIIQLIQEAKEYMHRPQKTTMPKAIFI